MDPTREIDPITEHALDEVLKELIRRVRQKLSELEDHSKVGVN